MIKPRDIIANITQISVIFIHFLITDGTISCQILLIKIEGTQLGMDFRFIMNNFLENSFRQTLNNDGDTEELFSFVR